MVMTLTASAIPARLEPEEPRRLRILLVDPNEVMRGLVKRTMQQAGHAEHDYLEAGGFEQAVHVARRHGPDLVVCDWGLSGPKGEGLPERMKAEGVGARFGFLSARAPEVRPSALEQGALFVLERPVVVHDFRGALAPLLSRGGVGLPTAEGAERALGSLIPVEIRARPSLGALLSGARPVLIGLYSGESAQGLIAMDLGLAAVAGSALAAAAPGALRRRARDEALPTEQMEEARALFHACARLFAAPRSPMALRAVHTRREALPSWGAAVAARPASQVCFEISVSSHSSGQLAMLVK